MSAFSRNDAGLSQFSEFSTFLLEKEWKIFNASVHVILSSEVSIISILITRFLQVMPLKR